MLDDRQRSLLQTASRVYQGCNQAHERQKTILKQETTRGLDGQRQKRLKLKDGAGESR